MLDKAEYYKNQIASATLANQVDIIIRKMILDGELEGNQQIKERELSQMLNVSTTPIKEALRSLEAEGLVYRKPRVGTFVSDVSKDIMLQIIFMRSALDGVAAYFACKNATNEEILVLEEILSKMKEDSEQDPESGFSGKQNEIFHNEIRNCAKNDFLSLLVSNMYQIDQIFRERALTHKPVEVKLSLSEHEAIFNAIKSRNAAEAERLMIRHVRRIAEDVVCATNQTANDAQ